MSKKKKSKSELRKERNIRRQKAKEHKLSPYFSEGEEILTQDVAPRSIDNEVINLNVLDHKLLNVNEANYIAGSYVTFFRSYQKYDLDNERIELGADDNRAMYIDGKKYVHVYGVVYDAKFGGDFRGEFIPDSVNRICIGSPRVTKEDGQTKKFSNHIWLFVGDCMGGTNISPNFNINMGDQLNIIAEVITYKNHGVEKYGIGKWYVVRSALLYWYKNKIHNFPSNKRNGFLFGFNNHDHEEINEKGESTNIASYQLVCRKDFEEYKNKLMNEYNYSFKYTGDDSALTIVGDYKQMGWLFD